MAWWDAITNAWSGVGNALNQGAKGLGINGVDLNWTHSTPFTGAGTPWGEGPQDPYKANYRAFDPNNYQSMDTSKIGAAMRQEIGQNAARSRQRLAAGLQAGGGGGADTAAALANLEGQQGQAENSLNAGLAQQDWNQKVQQWMQEMNLESAKAGQDEQRYARDQANRNAPWQFAGQLGGMALGGLTGGLAPIAADYLGKQWFGDTSKKATKGGVK